MILWILSFRISVLLGASRVPYSAAQDGNFFPCSARFIPRNHFPHVSLLVLAGLCFVFSISLKLKQAIAGILAMSGLCSSSRPGGRSDIGCAARGTQACRSRCGCIRCRGADDDRVGVALLADRATRKWGLRRSALGALAYLIRARRCANGRLKRKVISYLFPVFNNGSR